MQTSASTAQPTSRLRPDTLAASVVVLLVANLVQRRYRTEIPAFWRGQHAEAKPAARDKAAAVVG